MNAEPAVQRRLLELAAIDAELGRITHRRRTLPEQARVAEVETERNERKDAAVAVQLVLEDLDGDIAKLETEIGGVRKREDRDRSLLAAGGLAPKALTDLQHELDTLARRQGNLEDEELELMERREATDADHQRALLALAETDEALERAEREKDEALADLVTAQTRCGADRSVLVAALATELVAAYEKARAHSGIGAAALVGALCEGCRMEIDRAALGGIRAAADDAVLTCPECRTILVR